MDISREVLLRQSAGVHDRKGLGQSRVSPREPSVPLGQVSKSNNNDGREGALSTQTHPAETDGEFEQSTGAQIELSLTDELPMAELPASLSRCRLQVHHLGLQEHCQASGCPLTYENQSVPPPAAVHGTI